MGETRTPITKPNIAIVCDCGIKVDDWIVDFESSGVIDFEELSLHNGIGHNLYIKTIENSKNYEKGIRVFCLLCGLYVRIDKLTYDNKRKFNCIKCNNDTWSDDIE